jgi:hypothetical protein
MLFGEIIKPVEAIFIADHLRMMIGRILGCLQIMAYGRWYRTGSITMLDLE